VTTVIKTALLALAGVFLIAAPASAQDNWWDKQMAAARAQAGGGDDKPARASRAASKAKKAEQVAAVNESDDGSRPQRKSAAKRDNAPSYSRESLSGGESGIASYYWQPQRLAGGGWFNPDAYTAAHKTLPLGTRVRVTRVDNGNTVDVLINDRGPYVAGRVIDLSRRAAQSIGMTGQGLARVRVNVLGRG
jgi:rare lipoprotein A (peptidoglycan hydrolase)